ncbi:MAG: DMT family transporter [Ahrensia sp.]|nr:DMT family transporter [Ahrensia sp.]
MTAKRLSVDQRSSFSRLFPFLCLLIIGILWGATIPLTKIAVSTGHHSFGLIVWQLAIAAILLGVIVVIRRSVIHLTPRYLVYYAVIAISGTLMPNSISYWTAFHLPAGVMALIIAVVPVFSMLIAASLGFERATRARLLGIALGGVAIAMIVLPESSLPDPAKAVFVLIGLLAPLCYGAEGNYVAQRQPPEAGPFATLFAASVIGLLLLFPIGWASGTLIDMSQALGRPEWALIISSLLHVVAYCGYLWLTKFAGAVFAAQVAYVATPAGVVIAIVVLGEEPSLFIWLALALLMIGIALVQPKRSDDAQ